MSKIWSHLVRFFTSMQLTVVLLILSLVLVFVATLDQVNLGIWAVQEKYFRTFFVYLRPAGSQLALPVFPGGYLIGGLLFLNLSAAFVYRFKLTWRKLGIHLTHLGLVLLLLGELISGLLQEDFQMRLDEGQTSNFSDSPLENELAIIDTTNPDFDQVIAIPAKLLAKGNPIQHPGLPFRVVVRAYFPNAEIQMRNQMSNPPPPMATTGIGAEVAVTPQPVTYKPNERNLPAASIELVGAGNTSLGTWLVSLVLASQQSFTHEGKTWKLTLRPARLYKPFSLTLLKFSHDKYAGTEIPKNFSSKVRLRTPDGKTDRETLIYMNNPLRHAGLTFYQAGFENNDRTTVLQVVRNPGRQLPYIACILMSIGLVVQFGISLFFFIQKRAAAKT
ncbi:MAG: cytochrome c biogenesis protein ResB [Nibricoccus sp.]